jgi:anti-sigma factor RsiW
MTLSDSLENEMTLPGNEGDHITDLELAAYVDRGLNDADHARVESHLAVCPECRDHVVTTKVLLQRATRPRRLTVGISAALAAAAVAAFLLINPRNTQRQLPASDLTRAAVPANALTAYGPSGVTPRAHLRFVWGSAASGAAYRLTVSSEGGNPLWSTSAADTSVAMPDAIRFIQGQHYYWVVDALTTDGRTISTGLREFDVGP